MLDALQRRRPGHATVVAYLALFVALGGTGYATTVSNRTGNDAKGAVVAAKNPSQHEVARRGLLAQAAATSEPSGVAGAYGRVRSDGTVIQSRSSNVSSVSNPLPGIYCISLALGRAAQSGLVVTPDYASDSSSFDTGGNHAVAEWRSDAAGCPDGKLAVITGIHRSDGSLARRNQGFFFSVPAALAVYSARNGEASLPPYGAGGATIPPLVQLDLPPAGRYAVSAKLTVGGGNSDSNRATGSCHLGDADDASRFDYVIWDVAGEKKVLALQGVATPPSRGPLQLSCRNISSLAAFASEMKLTAIRIG